MLCAAAGRAGPFERNSMTRYDFLLFDADNTLFDFDRAERRALGLTLERFGFPPGEDTRRLYLTINRELWAQFDRGEIARERLVVERFSALSAAVGVVCDSAQVNRFYLERLGEGSDLLPGAEALCRALAGRYTLAIVTNGVASAQRGRFFGSPLPPLIPHLFISEEVGYSKPQREFFDAVLHSLGVTDQSRVLVLGDNLHADILGAANAGLDAVWYNPDAKPALPGLSPVLEARSFEDIARFLL